MPHKHKRKGKNVEDFDLPPTQIAKPLPVDTISKRKAVQTKAKGKANEDAVNKTNKRKRGADQKDDAPRAFKRMMAYVEGGRKVRSGLDDGVVPTKKQKNKAAAAAAAAAKAPEEAEEAAGEETKRPLPTIRPGERLDEFAHRVNAELPLSGLVSKTTRQGKDPLGLKVWRTRKEMKMHKLYDEWRLQDQKIKERRAEEQELAEERELEEEEATGMSWKMDMPSTGALGAGRKKRKGKEEDPWAALAAKRGVTKSGPRDVAKAPPELKVPTNKFVRGAVVNVANVPKAAGSLRQREELAEIRGDVVATYRKLMSAKRDQLSAKA